MSARRLNAETPCRPFSTASYNGTNVSFLSTEKAALLFPLAVRPENKETDSLISEEFPVSGITDNGLV